MSEEKLSFRQLIDSDTPVLVDFKAEWCGPCKAMAPVLKSVAHNWSGKLKVIKVDGDMNRNLLYEFGVEGFPTFILFRKGEILWKGVGAMSQSRMESAIREALTH